MLTANGGPTGTAATRVLVVDDDAQLADLAAVHLRERTHEGVTVVTETDPETALERVDSEPFACVVSDYQMPGMDGLALLAAVRERDAGLPFVLFTGAEEADLAGRARERGAMFVEKGPSEQYDRLASRVGTAVGAPAEA